MWHQSDSDFIFYGRRDAENANHGYRLNERNFRRWPNEEWMFADEVSYPDWVRVEYPYAIRKPPYRGMLQLSDSPLCPVAKWQVERDQHGREVSRKIVCITEWYRSDIVRRAFEDLIRKAERNYRSRPYGYAAPRQSAAIDYYAPPSGSATRAGDDSSVIPPFNGGRMGITTGLGDKVDAIAAKSPTMQQQLKAVSDARWHIAYQEPGLASVTNHQKQFIYIGDSYRDRPEWAVSQLSHELGHFEQQSIYDYSSKAAFLQSEQLSEGYATLSNITAQREILANGGPEIPLSVNRENINAYNMIYSEAQQTGNWGSAAAAIGRVYGDGEKSIDAANGQLETYNTIYGRFYDANYGNKH